MDDHNAHGPGDFRPLRLRLQPGDHVIDLTRPDVLLGRQSDADLRLPQPDVSRQHCRISKHPDGYLLRIDLAQRKVIGRFDVVPGPNNLGGIWSWGGISVDTSASAIFTTTGNSIVQSNSAPDNG